MPFSSARAVAAAAALITAPAAAQAPFPTLAHVGAAVRAADAPNTGAANPDLLLGQVTTFPSAAAARAACGRDRVVWADGYNGTLSDDTEPCYGATSTGAYVCERDAQRANDRDTKPQADMAGLPGRVLPFTPVIVGF